MKVSTWALHLSLAVLALCTVTALAQNHAVQLPTQAHPLKADSGGQLHPKATANTVSPDATESCTYQFTSGSGNTYLQFCVTVNGNIVEFQSPSGVEQLTPQGAAPFEGYGICDDNTSVGYYDYAYSDSGNWGSPTTVSHNGTSVKIERTTSDGLWTLTQTINMVAGSNPYAKVVMALKNNSGLTKSAQLIRYANVIPDNSGSTADYVENYDGTLDSAWGYLGENGTANGGPYGLIIQEFGNPTPTSLSYGREGFAINTTLGPSPCDPAADWIGTITNSVGSTIYWYSFVDLGKEKTATVTERYMSF